MAIYRLHNDWSSLGPFLLCIWPNSIVSCVSRRRFVSPMSQYTAHCLHASMQTLFFLHAESNVGSGAVA